MNMEDNDADVKESLVKATATFAKLKDIHGSKKLSVNFDLRIFNTNTKVAITDSPIIVTLPATEEISMAIKHMKSDKESWPDNMRAEALKSDIEVVEIMPYVLFRKIWDEE